MTPCSALSLKTDGRKGSRKSNGVTGEGMHEISGYFATSVP